MIYPLIVEVTAKYDLIFKIISPFGKLIWPIYVKWNELNRLEGLPGKVFTVVLLVHVEVFGFW